MKEKWIESYKTDDMTKCEYKPSIYIDKPKQYNGICEGYINPITNDASLVCMRCNFFIRNNN